MDAVFGLIAVAAALVIGAVVLREYAQRVKRFREREAEYDEMRERIKGDLARGPRLRPAAHRPAPPPPPPTRYVNDARRPTARPAPAARQTTSSTQARDESTWTMPAPSYDYDLPRSHSSSHGNADHGSHYAFSGGGGGSFDGGGASGDWSSSSDSCSSSSSDSSSSCSSD